MIQNAMVVGKTWTAGGWLIFCKDESDTVLKRREDISGVLEEGRSDLGGRFSASVVCLYSGWRCQGWGE